MSNEKRTEINELGEFALIDRITKNFDPKNRKIIKGVGDDTAVYDVGDNYLLMTTDMLLEGVHFDLSYVPLQHLGYKAIAINVSDIVAMNGIPIQINVGLGLSNRFSVEAIEVLYEGIKAACDEYKVDLVGGDTTSSASGLVISVTALGEVDRNKIAYRDGAREMDILCVTGDLGGAYMGLQILEREKQEYSVNPNMQPKLEKYDYIAGRQLKPEARVDIIHEFERLGIIPTSMIDISDGLISEAFHICNQSGLDVVIYEDKLPIQKQTYMTANEFGIDPSLCALNGGEDYELLFTIDQKYFEKIENHTNIHVIGYMQSKEKGRTFVTRNGDAVTLKAQGWKHF